MAEIALKDSFREYRIFQTRLIVAGIIVLSLTILLLVRLTHLQVLDHQRYATLSQSNRISIEPVPPVRGLIYDRNGIVVAQNFSAYNLEIVPDRVPDMDQLLSVLSEFIELRPSDLERFNRLRKKRSGFESIPLRNRLSEQEAAQFAVNRHRVPGAELLARLQRHYPLGALGVHVIGYVGRISDRDLEKIDRVDYRGTDYIGKLGVEAYYEQSLLGDAGYKRVETNAHGREVRLLDREPAAAGKNIHLTLDARLQAVAEASLGDRRGAVVALDPKTGAVLAFASTPAYDPNPFVNGIDVESYKALRESLDRPLLNRALTGRYAPGSTIKTIFGVAALEAGRGAAKRTLCPGWFSLRHSQHRYRCWKGGGHGWVDLHDAIVESCDVYFYDLASALGIDRMHAVMKRFGFGAPTGIDLNGEASGLVPSSQWKRRARGTPWYPGETVITGIGQGFTLVTPLQLAHATSVIASRGVGMRPRVVSALQDRASGTRAEYEPEVITRAQVRNERYFDLVIRAMTDVVHGAQGTARRIGRDAKYRIAGKTGTAQVIGIAQDERYDEERIAERLRDHALFIGFAPVKDPRIAVAVVVENGGSGSSTAAPIARTIMDYYLLGEGAGVEAGDRIAVPGEASQPALAEETRT